ncbi:uncharacterized protein FOMMEDRAFT_163702 [Fomitiporia mediterranea MF3/22]|uniref:Uncharacterized protein n=1 Tax=Fomitiporia mediterranea (strain MF3/22) TaxID=694068 RepID=R7SGF0_FOMME|nr:uncharacterized protein FOMMEDRAFT_163702 [Fomitiporia mediterranea MF3/22]EJC97372.1 hypothetical protein FOMMEDRAFT_163702 [Fomitiporia mediterranea MF3/22]
MEDFAIPEYALPRASLVPIPQAAQHGLEPIEHLIIICRSPLLAISEENYESEAAKIARLFAEDKGHSKSFLANRPDEDDTSRQQPVSVYPLSTVDRPTIQQSHASTLGSHHIFYSHYCGPPCHWEKV